MAGAGGAGGDVEFSPAASASLAAVRFSPPTIDQAPYLSASSRSSMTLFGTVAASRYAARASSMLPPRASTSCMAARAPSKTPVVKLICCATTVLIEGSRLPRNQSILDPLSVPSDMCLSARAASVLFSAMRRSSSNSAALASISLCASASLACCVRSRW